MRRRQIDGFFSELDRRLAAPARVILTGAACGALMGHIRPSADVDFEIRSASGKAPARLEEAVRSACAKAGIAAQYSTDISRWSMIDYLDYRRTAVFYKKIGRLDIFLISPECWTIGKMARFLAFDVADMRKIIRCKKLEPGPLLKVWARALRSSDPCLETGLFRDHVEAFLKLESRKLWKQPPEPLILDFRKMGRIQK